MENTLDKARRLLKEAHPESILDEAKRLTEGDRQSQYGHPLINFHQTAIMWEIILGVIVRPEQIPLCLICLKICREIHQQKRDNRVDIAGYANTLQMVHDVLEGKPKDRPHASKAKKKSSCTGDFKQSGRKASAGRRGKRNSQGTA